MMCHTELNYKLERALKHTLYQFITRSTTTPILFTVVAFILVAEMAYIFTEMQLAPFAELRGKLPEHDLLVLTGLYEAALILFLIIPLWFMIRIRKNGRQQHTQQAAIISFILSSIVSLFSTRSRLNQRISTLPGHPDISIHELRRLYRSALKAYLIPITLMQLCYFLLRALPMLATHCAHYEMNINIYLAQIMPSDVLLLQEVGFTLLVTLFPVLVLLWPYFTEPRRLILPS